MYFPYNFSFSNQRWHWFSDIKRSFLFLLHHRVYWLSEGSVLESGHTHIIIIGTEIIMAAEVCSVLLYANL